jgi:serine protease Do
MKFHVPFHKWTVGGSIGLALAFVAGLVVSGAAPRLAASATQPSTSSTIPSAPSPVAAPVAPTSYADAVAKAAPSVVTVEVQKKAQAVMPAFNLPNDPFFRQFFWGTPPQSRQQQAPIEEGLGSGVIVSTNGDILTNNHVVNGADHVTVTLADGREFTAKVVGTDPPSDLAVVHIDATSLPALALADSSKVRVGDVVLAIGDPLGVGQTVTMGIISAKGRTTSVGDGSYEDFLQTDAPINRGNSGGALITANGELVGINSQIVSNSGGSIGIGFAIPSNMARTVMHQLITTGHVRRGMLGVEAQTITSDLAKSLDMPEVRGALIATVDDGSPAAKAGLKPGDVIETVNGQEVQNSNDLRNTISSMAPGTTVNLGIRRDGRSENVSATLGEMPENSSQSKSPSSTGSDLGLTVEALTPSIAQQLGVPRGTTGVAVTNVDSESAAARAGIQNGDVIRRVNGRRVESASAFHEAIGQSGNRPALLYVQRGDQTFYVALSAR